MSRYGEARALYKLICLVSAQPCELFSGCGFPECTCKDRCAIYEARLRGDIK